MSDPPPEIDNCTWEVRVPFDFISPPNGSVTKVVDGTKAACDTPTAHQISGLHFEIRHSQDDVVNIIGDEWGYDPNNPIPAIRITLVP